MQHGDLWWCVAQSVDDAEAILADAQETNPTQDSLAVDEQAPIVVCRQLVELVSTHGIPPPWQDIEQLDGDAQQKSKKVPAFALYM